MSDNKNAGIIGCDPKIAHVEFHDAKLDGVAIHSGGNGIISFGHIVVYIEESFDHYVVWSYSADLHLQGVEQFSLDKLLGKSDYVSDGKVVDVAGEEIELKSALNWTGVDCVELILSSSAKLFAKVSRVQLDLLTPRTRLEEWTGSLK